MRRRGLYSEAELNYAVSRIVENKERGISVSKETGIPYRTLMQRVRERKRGIVIEKKKRGSKPSLALNYEQELLAWMLEMQNSGTPVTRKEIIERANSLIKQLKPNATLGEGWYRRFIHRHPSLEVQTPGATLERGIAPLSESSSVAIIIRGYKKRAPKSQDVPKDGQRGVEVDQSILQQRDLEHRWQMERERLAIEKQTNERIEREAQLNERILLAKATEAELQLKVARAKAKQELERAGIPPSEIDALLQ
ncbi:hypothetical protein LEN26_007922 [Aphanomyces euteiches]|nr:hypothetical protein AeMF1_002699 [Aphanomyces euteiches]KAH9131118.1 hypothetical protein LEN26_007922 [Aphanomyces euteiches]KAH9188664.1 hypothetical protein AeNC1_009354 [Aphanomyces euteiches]